MIQCATAYEYRVVYSKRTVGYSVWMTMTSFIFQRQPQTFSSRKTHHMGCEIPYLSTCRRGNSTNLKKEALVPFSLARCPMATSFAQGLGHIQSTKGNKNNQQLARITCYSCGGKGHLAPDCSSPKFKNTDSEGYQGYQGRPWYWQPEQVDSDADSDSDDSK